MLNFQNLKQTERTKHVHGLHPYKGKFIPQLVQYVMNNFKQNDWILDPFCGSGTTLIQANQMGINSVGIEVSQFNTLLSNLKVKQFDLQKVKEQSQQILKVLEYDDQFKAYKSFDDIIKDNISKGQEIPHCLIDGLINKKQQTFLQTWLMKPAYIQTMRMLDVITNLENEDLFKLILSRTVRSCRTTKHYQLGTIKKPTYYPYYCRKHSKMCKPTMFAGTFFKNYLKDTIKRLEEFDQIRTDTYQKCYCGDSRDFDLSKYKFNGVITSPPYFSLIDYHQQHKYAYQLFDIVEHRQIGTPKYGRSKKAKQLYVDDMVDVFNNIKKYMINDFSMYVIVNDKENLYQQIYDRTGLEVIDRLQRRVTNTTEVGRSSKFTESIFRLKSKKE